MCHSVSNVLVYLEYKISYQMYHLYFGLYNVLGLDNIIFEREQTSNRECISLRDFILITQANL